MIGKFAKEMLLYTGAAILICSAIGYMLGYPAIGFAIGCVLVVTVWAMVRFIAWLFIELVKGFFTAITGGPSKK